MDATNNLQLSPRLVALIDETVKRTMIAMLAERSKMPDDAYKQTIARLKAYSMIREHMESCIAKLQAMREEGTLQGKSKSIIRFSSPSVRTDPEEMFEAICKTLEAHIEADRIELDEITNALQSIEKDPYYAAIYDRYIEGKNDLDIAEKLYCNDSTIRRNRERLVNRLAIRLYGVRALPAL